MRGYGLTNGFFKSLALREREAAKPQGEGNAPKNLAFVKEFETRRNEEVQTFATLCLTRGLSCGQRQNTTALAVDE